MKFTFKKYPSETWYPNMTDIKINRMKCGSIQQVGQNWIVNFIVYDSTKKCGWKWVSCKDKFPTESDARIWIKENENNIKKQLNIAPLED